MPAQLVRMIYDAIKSGTLPVPEWLHHRPDAYTVLQYAPASNTAAGAFDNRRNHVTKQHSCIDRADSAHKTALQPFTSGAIPRAKTTRPALLLRLSCQTSRMRQLSQLRHGTALVNVASWWYSCSAAPNTEAGAMRFIPKAAIISLVVAALCMLLLLS